MAKGILFTIAGICSLTSMAQADYQYFTITAIGTPTSVSNGGSVIGSSGSNYGHWNPVCGEAPTNIGGNSTSGQGGISANGRYVGGTANAGDGKTEMARYDRVSNTWTTLGGGGGFSTTTRSVGYGISADGSTVFGFGYGTPTGTATFTGIRALSSTEGVMKSWSVVLNASSINRVQACNTDGTIVAGQQTSYLVGNSGTTGNGAFWADNAGNHPMFVPATTNFLNLATAMSGNGQFVGGNGNVRTLGTYATYNHFFPYVYDTQTSTYVTIAGVAGLNGNPVHTAAGTPRISGFVTGMSSNGDKVVGFYRQDQPAVYIDKQWGFIYTRSTNTTESLDAWAAANGVIVPSGTYLIPMAISADGNSIAGLQLTSTNFGTSFLISSAVSPKITGNLTLQETGDDGNAGTESISYTLTDGSQSFTGSVSVDDFGGGSYSIQIPSVAQNGNYTLRFKGGTFLSSTYSVVLNGGAISLNGSLRNGDVDQDGEVGTSDFDAVVFQFGAPGAADCDNDGEVGASDFDMVVANFGWTDL